MSILISPPTTASKPRYLSFNSLENLILSLCLLSHLKYSSLCSWVQSLPTIEKLTNVEPHDAPDNSMNSTMDEGSEYKY